MSIICYRWLVWSLQVRFGWKPIPSVARVTGTKSRDYKARRDDCLEDSTQLICSFTFGSVRTRSKSSRITLIRRIFKPSPTPPWRGFSLVTDCQLETQVASARPFIPKGGQEGGLIREKNRSVASAYPWLILNVASEPKASEHILWGTVFQTAVPSCFIIPRLRPGLLSLCSLLSSRQNHLLLIHITALMPSFAIDDYHEACQ